MTNARTFESCSTFFIIKFNHIIAEKKKKEYISFPVIFVILNRIKYICLKNIALAISKDRLPRTNPVQGPILYDSSLFLPWYRLILRKTRISKFSKY